MTKFIDKKVNGFSVAEAILALFIAILCIQILVGLLKTIKIADKSSEPINEVAMSYVQLEKFLKENGHVEVGQDASNSSKIILKKKIGEKDGKPEFTNYRLEQYSNMIRLTGINGGHMPLLLGIKSASFSHEEDYFKILLTESDNRKSELTFKVDKPLPVKKAKKDKETKHKDDKEKENSKVKKEDKDRKETKS